MKTITIMPRRAGKTMALLENFREHLESGKEGIFVAINQMHADRLKRENPDIKYHIYSSYQFTECSFKYGRLNAKKKLFLDEYLSYEQRVKEALWDYRHYDIQAFTTSNKLYSQQILDLVRYFKKHHVGYKQAKSAYEQIFYSDVFDEYYYNFITDEDCTVYSSGLRTAYVFLGPEQFDIQIMGEWTNGG